MRRAAAGVLLAGLVTWVAVGALTAEPPRARAQTDPPPTIEIGRTQGARFLPARRGTRPITILALGSDARPGEQVDRRLADAIHLITVNPREGGATVLGFPRDSYVQVPGVGQRKINEGLFNGGSELMVDTVEELTGIPIDYYLLTSFEGLPAMVEAIGKIDVDIPYAMNDPASGAVFEAGPRRINGNEALALARNRKSTPNGDFSRSENQGLLIVSALAELHRQVSRNPTALFTWAAVGARHTQTNLSLSEVLELFLTALRVDPDNVDHLVAKGSVGSAGAASVVLLSEANRQLYDDLRDDGLVG